VVTLVRRRTSLAVLLSLLAVLLTACSTKVVGQTGVGVDREGRAIGYVVVCRKEINSLILFYNDENGAEHIAGKWHSAVPVSKEGAIILQHPPDGWTMQVSFGSLLEGVKYHLSGVSDDNKTSTVDVSFDLNALARLGPERILFQQGDSARQVSDIRGMRAQVCD
jgi:hypothetical protein